MSSLVYKGPMKLNTNSSFIMCSVKTVPVYRSGGRRSRLVRPLEKNLNLTIIGLT